MAGEKVSMILRSKTNLSAQEIEQLSDAEGWAIIYSSRPAKTERPKKENQICFTGFDPDEKHELQTLAAQNGLDVVQSVTKSLAYLCIGDSPGPVKLKQAKEQQAIILDQEQFHNFLNSGEIPGQA